MNRESRYPKTILGLCVLASVVGTQALTAVGFAQDQENWDSVTRINDELISGVATTYFNAEHCADPSSTGFDLAHSDRAGATQAFIWVGLGDNPGCQDQANRGDDTLRCRPLAANPKQLGNNTTVFDITLQELIDSELVDCENTALTGAPYRLYAFRNQAPGDTDVPTDGYGTAPITVDVVPPAELSITSALERCEGRLARSVI